MLVDIIRDLVGAARDLKLVGRTPGRLTGNPEGLGWLEAAVTIVRADVVVTVLEEGDADTLQASLAANAGVRVIGIDPTGRQAFLYRGDDWRVPLGEVSPDGLLAAIRDSQPTE
jgi:hypothetical protein